MKSRIILITGATSGIGEATAHLLAKKGERLILHGRSLEKLQKLSADLKTKYSNELFTICFDIQNKEAVKNGIESIPENWKKINTLINNAGLALDKSSFEKCSLDDWDTMMQTNVNGLLYVSHAIINLMLAHKEIEDKSIINISSIAGTQVYKGGNVYCASKHAVHAITKAMRADLLEYNIKVSSISPGNVKTNFANVRFKNDDEKSAATYDGYKPLQAIDIAELIEFILDRPKHVNINDIEVTPTNQASAYYLHREKK